MATSGPVGSIFEVNVTLDAPIFAAHTAKIKKTETIQLFTPGNTPVDSIDLTFTEAAQGAQQVKISGNKPGTYPLPAEVTSAYYQRLGELKKELSSIPCTFFDEPAEGFSGHIAGVIGWNSTPSSGIVAEGTFKLRKQNAIANSIITIVKSKPSTDVVGLLNMRVKVIRPDSSIAWFDVTNGIWQHTMSLVGAYTFYFYELFRVAETVGTGLTSPPEHTYAYKNGISSAPTVDSRNITINLLIYRKQFYKSIGTGPLNVFSQSVTGFMSANVCGALTSESSEPANFSAFVGTTTKTGEMNMVVNGYYTGSGTASHNFGPFYMNGIYVRSSAEQVQLIRTT